MFPVHSIEDGKCTCRKAGCNSPGKHPRTGQGVKDASNDSTTVENWLRTWPDTNWGLACGKESNVIVIDIDAKSGGFPSLEEYENSRPAGPLPETLISLTGGNGRHLFFTYPTDLTVGNRVNWLPGLDVRSDGGYVILPPGTHISGGRYKWKNDAPLAELPADVAQSIINKQGSNSAKVTAGLNDVASILEGLKEGSRDDTLFKWACRLRRQHSSDADGGRAAVTLLVMAAAQMSNFPKDEAQKCIESAFKQDHSDMQFPLTDIGNGERLFHAMNGEVFNMEGVGIHRPGKFGGYELQTKQQLLSFARTYLPDAVLSEGEDKDHQKWWKTSSSMAGIKNSVEALSIDDRILRQADECNVDPLALACRDQVVDLATSTARKLEPGDFITQNTNVRFVPGAEDERWKMILDGVTASDRDLEAYLQMEAGYFATGLTKEESIHLVSGLPASGKSTYYGALVSVLGSYAVETAPETFLRGTDPKTSHNVLAKLPGVRLSLSSETKKGARFNDELMKRIAGGGEAIEARLLYRDFFSYVPRFKTVFITNHDPKSDDKGMKRRLRKTKFDHVIPEERRDSGLKEAIKKDESLREAILAWIVEGARKYLAAGELPMPPAVQQATDEYTHGGEDRMAEFIEDHVVLGEECWTSRNSLESAYNFFDSDNQFRKFTDFRDELCSILGIPTTAPRERPARGAGKQARLYPFALKGFPCLNTRPDWEVPPGETIY